MQKILITFGIIAIFFIIELCPLEIGQSIDPIERNLFKNQKLSISEKSHENPTFLIEEYEKIQSQRIFVSVPKKTISSSGKFLQMIDSAWPMSCHDLHHTCQSPYSTSENPNGEEKWRFETSGYFFYSSPVLDSNGTIYVGSFDKNFFAINPNGTLKWVYDLGDIVSPTAAIANDGTIYIGAWTDHFYALNPNGTLKWSLNTDGDISSSAAIADDGTIYFGTWGNKIYAVNPNGTVKWHYTTGDFVVSDPAIGDDGTIYIGSADGNLYTMNPNGTLKWRFQTDGWIKSHPSIALDGTIYFTSFDGNTYALDPNGTEKWHGSFYGSGCNAVAIASDGTLYVAGRNLYALYPNGTQKWVFVFGDIYHAGHSSPVLSADGTIYIGLEANSPRFSCEIVVVNPDGTLKWQKIIGNFVDISTPCIASDGTVYIGSSNDNPEPNSYGYLHAFGPAGSNLPPEKPTITGPSRGHVDWYHNYTIKAMDPEGQEVRYWVDWGDNYPDIWAGPYPSNEEIVIRHAWSEKGTYTIRVRAEDTQGAYSDWATLKVTMPLSYEPLHFHFLEWLLDRFPHAFPILRQIINR